MMNVLIVIVNVNVNVIVIMKDDKAHVYFRF